MEETLRLASAHKGAAFVEILQNCNVYNDLAWNVLYDKDSKVLLRVPVGARQAHHVRAGRRPPRPGAGRAQAQGGQGQGRAGERALGPRLARSRDRDAARAALGARVPVPMGVLLNLEGEPTYEEIVVQQEQKAISERGPGDIAKLLVSGETWKIG